MNNLPKKRILFPLIDQRATGFLFGSNFCFQVSKEFNRKERRTKKKFLLLAVKFLIFDFLYTALRLIFHYGSNHTTLD